MLVSRSAAIDVSDDVLERAQVRFRHLSVEIAGERFSPYAAIDERDADSQQLQSNLCAGRPQEHRLDGPAHRLASALLSSLLKTRGARFDGALSSMNPGTWKTFPKKFNRPLGRTVAEVDAADFAQKVFGQFVAELNVLGDLVGRQL